MNFPQWKRDFFVSLALNGGTVLDSYQVALAANQRKASKLKDMRKIVKYLSQSITLGMEVGDENFFKLKDRLLAELNISVKLNEMKLLFHMAQTTQSVEELPSRGVIGSCLQFIKKIFTEK